MIEETDDSLYTCVITCKICGEELNRLTGVPIEHASAVSYSAPSVGRCSKESHNSHSVEKKMNANVTIRWFRETLDGLVFIESFESPEIELQ